MSSRVVKRTKRGLPRETNCLFRRGWTHAVSAWQVTSWFLSLLLTLFAWGENVLSTSFIILAYLGCISSLKFKSGFLIWKRMFHFFSNIQNRISFKFINFIILNYRSKRSTKEVDSLDHIQNQILLKLDPRRFFTPDSKRVNTASCN